MEIQPLIVKGRKKNIRASNAPALIFSDFKHEIGQVADIISFSKEFLKRYPSPKQEELLRAFGGDKGGEWNQRYHEFVMAVGMKGGKNFVTEIIVAYVGYFISCLKDPHQYFTKITRRPVAYTEDKNFDLVNVSSVDESQARRVFFDSIKSVLRLAIDPKTQDRWFERYARLDLRAGGFGDIKDRIITFPQVKEGKGTLRFMSFNSTATAPEGAHFFVFIADELSRADTKAKYNEAKKLYELGLKNTAVSFPKRTAKVIGFSYLNDTDFDLTNERYLESFKTDKIYGKLYKTWEFNPAVTKEDLKDEYISNPINAQQIYECIKPKSRDAFFQPYIEKIGQAKGTEKNKISYKIEFVSRKTNDNKVHNFTSAEVLGIQGDTKQRVFALDPSKVRDRFAIAGGYASTIDTLKIDYMIGNDKEVISTNIKPVIDFLLVIEPKDKKPIDYLKIGDIITLIISAFPNTVGIYSDHYQNEKLRQEIIQKGVQAETYNFSNQQQLRLYTLLRANIWNNNFEICNDHHLLRLHNQDFNLSDFMIWELEHLIKDGTRVDHPDWGSKDLADTIALCNSEIMKLESLGYKDEVDIMNEPQFKRLCETYMLEKHKLIVEEIPEPEQIPILSIKLDLSIQQTNKIAQFVKEHYNY